MMTSWKFHNPTAIEFGVGSVEAALPKIPYKRTLLITSAGMTRRGTVSWVKQICGGAVVEVYDQVTANPELAALDRLATRYCKGGFDSIVALGGGSALDTGKILGLLLEAPTQFTLYNHFVNRCPIPAGQSLPVIAIPTTAGTGSEVTPFATVWDAKAEIKYSLTDPRMFPIQALVDPVLTKELPWDITLATGLDALCQAFESIWNRNASPISMAYAIRAAKLAWGALHEGESLMRSSNARANIMEASLLAGLAISQTRTALCHSISYPITARFGLPHGLACAFTMPAVLRFNSEADDGRLSAVALHLGSAGVRELAKELALLLRRLGLDQAVKSALTTKGSLGELMPRMITPGRADNNLRALGPQDLALVLAEAAQDMRLN